MNDIEFGGPLPTNYEMRLLCVLVLDNSGSMNGAPINELNQGINKFAEYLKKDSVARNRVEVSLVTFNHEIHVLQEPALIDEFSMPLIQVAGTTKLVDGMNKSFEIIENRKNWYKQHGLNYYRPFIVLISDGMPDQGQDIDGLAQKVKSEESSSKYVFMPLGLSNMPPEGRQVLQKISQKDLQPLPIEPEGFGEFFKWLSKSLSMVSRSLSGDSINFDKPSWSAGWTELKV